MPPTESTTRPCAHCGAPFDISRYAALRRYCGVPCRQDAFLARHRTAGDWTSVCQACGVTFATPRRQARTYCSTACQYRPGRPRPAERPPRPIRRCQRCSVRLNPDRKSYCSQACRYPDLASRPLSLCARCGAAVPPDHRAYCSDACVQTVARQRHRLQQQARRQTERASRQAALLALLADAEQAAQTAHNANLTTVTVSPDAGDGSVQQAPEKGRRGRRPGAVIGSRLERQFDAQQTILEEARRLALRTLPDGMPRILALAMRQRGLHRCLRCQGPLGLETDLRDTWISCALCGEEALSLKAELKARLPRLTAALQARQAVAS